LSPALPSRLPPRSHGEPSPTPYGWSWPIRVEDLAFDFNPSRTQWATPPPLSRSPDHGGFAVLVLPRFPSSEERPPSFGAHSLRRPGETRQSGQESGGKSGKEHRDRAGSRPNHPAGNADSQLHLSRCPHGSRLVESSKPGNRIRVERVRASRLRAGFPIGPRAVGGPADLQGHVLRAVPFLQRPSFQASRGGQRSQADPNEPSSH
jgi:hypothetical protein